jgi:hypothetical protein
MVDPTPDMDNPDYARFAWRRFRRLMIGMTAVAAVAVMLSLLALWWFTGPMPIHMITATILGVFVTVMLGGALMGLVFLSSGTGYDGKIEDPSRPEDAD